MLYSNENGLLKTDGWILSGGVKMCFLPSDQVSQDPILVDALKTRSLSFFVFVSKIALDERCIYRVTCLFMPQKRRILLFLLEIINNLKI